MSFKYWVNIIELEAIFEMTDCLTVTSKMSKSEEEDIELGLLKLSFIAIFLSWYNSGFNWNESSSALTPCLRMISNVEFFILEIICWIPSVAIIWTYNIP